MEPAHSTGSDRRARHGARLCALCAACVAWLVPLIALAQDREQPERIRIREDTILNSTPRYELRLSDTATSSSARFWHRVDQLPVYERVSLDADGLMHGPLDVHILAWGAGDALMPQHGPVASGDFATAYAHAQLLPPLSAWGGRRFIVWGLPGGLHLDGIGVEQRSEIGLHFEAVAGRPVTPVFTTLGSHSEYEQPTFASGASAGYESPGKLSAGLSFMQRTAHGIVADRTVMGTLAYRPYERLDLLASGSVDVAAGLQEARAQVAYLLVDDVEPDLSYVHADPQKLLPSWSILSMFASDAYDEGAAGVTTRFSQAVTGRVEVAVRHAYLPGNKQHDDAFGYRTDASVRVAPVPRGTDFVVELSRRDLAPTALLVARIAVSFAAYRALRVAPELGAAIDEHDTARSALLVRGAAELPIDAHWRTALTLDFARTPIALAEVRSMLRVSYVLDTRAR
jgi:hypothetical protein